MSTRTWKIPGGILAAALSLLGQPGRLAGPISGYVFDGAAHTLRPVRGIPGAALLGDPVDFGFEATAVHMAPRQDSALVVAADGSLHVMGVTSEGFAERSCDGLSGVPERVAFSPSGTAAALYAARRVQVVTGLPDSPQLVTTLDLGGVSTALAISDDGAYLVSAADGAVRLLGTAGDNRKIMDAASGALLAFAPGSHSVAIWDSTAGLVWFRDLLDSSPPSVLAANDDAVAAALVFSTDGRRLYLASPAARSVASFELETAERRTIACSCAPASLVRMGNVFRLNEPGAEPLWLLDAAPAEPRIVFVPALAPPSAN